MENYICFNTGAETETSVSTELSQEQIHRLFHDVPFIVSETGCNQKFICDRCNDIHIGDIQVFNPVNEKTYYGLSEVFEII